MVIHSQRRLLCISIYDGYMFCTADERITENVFANANNAEMLVSRLSQDDFGTLYVYEDGCRIPDISSSTKSKTIYP